MKKTIILIFSSLFLLSSCFFSNDDKVNDAKKELWIIKESINYKETEKQEKSIENVEYEKDLEKPQALPSFEITYESPNKFIEIDNIPTSKISIPEVKISWKTLVKVDKIDVSFSNEESSYPKDNYTLTKFKSWDKTFIYHASSKFNVLDYGKNLYTITAFSWDEVAKVNIVINIPANYTPPKNKEITYEKKLIWNENDTLYMSFPESPDFWELIMSWTDSFTYSKVDNLEVKKVILDELFCDGITYFLEERLDSWFYWNTCRDIVKDKGISFYVLRLDWEEYFYEKYYIDNYHWLIWTYLIETWNGVSPENIKEKNSLFKEKNEDFKSVDLVDNLFREIVR